MNRWNKCWAMVCLLILCIGMCGCGKEERKPVTISMIHAWGGTEKDHAAMRSIYEDFEKENPEIVLQMISMPTGKELQRKVEDLIMVGDVPDIVNFSGMGQNQTYDFMVENDLALNLMPYVKRNPDLARELSEANLDDWKTMDHKLYSIADVLTLSGGYWYNKAILEAAGVEQLPVTWEEFLQMCEKISAWSKSEQNHVEPHHISGEGYMYVLDHLLAEGNGPKNKKIPDQENYRQAIKIMKELYQFSALRSKEYTYLDETSMFNEGKLGIYVNGVWGAPMIHSTVETGYALLPTFSGESMACKSAGIGYVLSKSGNVEKQEASVRFLKYMLSEPVQKRILRETEQIPANPYVSLKEFASEKERLYHAVEVVQSAEHKIQVPQNLWSERQTVYFREHIIKVLSGELSEIEFGEQLGIRKE